MLDCDRVSRRERDRSAQRAESHPARAHLPVRQAGTARRVGGVASLFP